MSKNCTIITGKVMSHSEIENPIIRTKWEVIETPFTFTEKDFATWLK